MRIKVLLMFILVSTVSIAQTALGTWDEHLPYKEGKAVCLAEDKLYCVTSPSLFYVDLLDNTIHKISTINGLSELNANTVQYDEETKTLVIGYNSGNIDLIVNNEIINIADIERSFIQSSKTINDIFILDSKAYLSTGFGIVVLDLIKQEIKETYTLGDLGSYININDVSFLNDTLFAATDIGMKYGLTTTNLSSFLNWKDCPNTPAGIYNNVESFNDKIYANFSHRDVFNTDTLFSYSNGLWGHANLENDSNKTLEHLSVSEGELITTYSFSFASFNSNEKQVNVINYYGTNTKAYPLQTIKYGTMYWVADEVYGLSAVQASGAVEFYVPSGPIRPGAWDVEYSDGKLWMAHGALLPNIQFKGVRYGVSRHSNGSWKSFHKGGMEKLYDVHKVLIDPDDSEHIFAASWGSGLIEFKDGVIQEVYQDSNSLITFTPEWTARTLVGGLDFDANKNLWVSVACFGSSNVAYPLVCFDGNKFHGFDLNKYLTNQNWVRQVLVDEKNGFIWVISYTNGVIVYDTNGTLDDTSDDRSKLLTQGLENGDLPTKQVVCMAEDQDGKLWFGSEEGIFVISNPAGVFDGTGNAEQIIIEQDETFHYLLETETVNSIKVDGGNRKWFGTNGGGVYLFDEEGKEQIYHFNTSNSPLISNLVYDVEVNGNTGEALFSTDKGLVSFMADATDADQYDGPVYAFPNPVSPDYQGDIGIKGLVKNSQVKITDITGNVIFEARSEGGMVKWDGKSLSGKKAQSGVYLVFSVSDDGSESAVAKILFLN